MFGEHLLGSQMLEGSDKTLKESDLEEMSAKFGNRLLFRNETSIPQQATGMGRIGMGITGKKYKWKTGQ